MTKHPRRPTSLSDANDSSESTPGHEIGYRRPPVHSRFKPGRSGNPKGRRKGTRNVRTIVETALQQRITIREGDRSRSLSKFEAVVLTMLNRALQGDAKTLTVLIQLIRSVGMTEEPAEPTNTEPVTAYDDEIIADFFRRQGGSMQSATASEDAIDAHGSASTEKGDEE